MFETTVLRGALLLDKFVEGQCFTSWSDFVKAIPTLFSVEIPALSTGVIVSSSQPLDTQRDFMWVRRDPSGAFLGLYVFATGQWRLIWPVPNGLFRMYGDSRSVPHGYILADTNNPFLSSTQVTAIMATWTLDSTATYYIIFDVTIGTF